MTDVARDAGGRHRVFSMEAHHLRSLLLLLGIFVLFYFSALSDFSLAIDDEYGAVRETADIWAGQGRWLNYLIEHFITPQPVVVFFPLFAFGLGCSLAFLLLAHALRLGLDDARTYLLFAVFCAFPTVPHIANFSTNLLGLGVGIAAICAALLLYANGWLMVQKPGSVSRLRLLRHFLVQVALVAIATGGYQTMVLTALVGYLGLMMYLSPETRLLSGRWWALHLWAAAVVLGGALLSEAVGYLLRTALNIPMVYVDTFLKPQLLLDDPLQVMGETLKSVRGVYTGSAETYGYTLLAIPAIIVLGLAGLMARPTTTGRNSIHVMVQALAILLIPFLLNLLTGGWMPQRSLLAVPLAISLMAALAVFSHLRFIRVTGMIVVAILAIQSLYVFSALQSGKRIQFQHDMMITSEIYRRAAEKIPDFDSTRTYEMDVYGGLAHSPHYPIPRSSTLGASMLNWDAGSPGRTVALMKVLGYPNFKVVSGESRQRTIRAMMAMPTWPHPDAVAFKNGVLVVKFADRPSKYHQPLVNQSMSVLKAGPFWSMDFLSPLVQARNVDILNKDASSMGLSAGNDAQVLFSTGQVEAMDRCLVLELGMNIKAASPDTAQLYYAPKGKDFMETNSVSAAVRGGNDNARVIFTATSSSGFSDRLRLDPVVTQQASVLSDASLKCLMER